MKPSLFEIALNTNIHTVRNAYEALYCNTYWTLSYHVVQYPTYGSSRVEEKIIRIPLLDE